MKDTITDANFPRTVDGRVYHLGIRTGEAANRIVTVGSPSRARAIASYLDSSPTPFILESERGFITITGRYHGVPISIVSIGMGHPNMDFFVREVRECIHGDMLVIRLGSCGALLEVPPGSIAVPKSSVAISRNYDFDFVSGSSLEKPYRISKPVPVDEKLHEMIVNCLEETRPNFITTPILSDTINASADSFYSSQGRQTSFPDHNDQLIQQLCSEVDKVATLEMETFQLLHLARSWSKPRQPAHLNGDATEPTPLTTTAVSTIAAGLTSNKAPDSNSLRAAQPQADAVEKHETSHRIRAAAAQMVFAARLSKDFITPQQVVDTEAWTGRAVLEALCRIPLGEGSLHPDEGSVWQQDTAL